jgi:hypothetical protein
MPLLTPLETKIVHLVIESEIVVIHLLTLLETRTVLLVEEPRSWR